jgi:hypothetical protein
MTQVFASLPYHMFPSLRENRAEQFRACLGNEPNTFLLLGINLNSYVAMNL